MGARFSPVFGLGVGDFALGVGDFGQGGTSVGISPMVPPQPPFFHFLQDWLPSPLSCRVGGRVDVHCHPFLANTSSCCRRLRTGVGTPSTGRPTVKSRVMPTTTAVHDDHCAFLISRVS